ncbi:MAG: proprotein convertase P-domain-containing protein, partial [Bacteroidota bacterium]
MLAFCCLCSVMLTAQTFTAPVTGQAVPAVGTGGGSGADILANATEVTIPVTGAGVVGDDVLVGEVAVDISHTFSGDMNIDLIAPDGSIHRLSLQNGGGADDAYANTAFSDEAFGNSIDLAVAPFDGSFFASAGAMNIAFGGSPMAGNWVLRISDVAGGDSGTFNGASITFVEGEDFSAPDQEVNLAGIGNINLTLTDDCSGLVIPEMVLAGDFDSDNDGVEVGLENFVVTVMDGNTDNGPIVDGCGTFQYRVEVASSGVAPPTIGFTGDYDPDGANVITQVDAGATLDFTDTGFEMGATTGGNALLQVTFVEEGPFRFNYDAVLESEIIADVYVINFEGEFVYRNTDVDPTGDLGTPDAASGKIPSLPVEAGESLLIGLIGDGFQTGGQESSLEISDFTFTPAPMGFDVIGFTTTWGEVTAEDKTAPTVEETPDDVQLLCVDIDDNNVSTLDNSISRCYEVDPSTGATVPNSMDPALNLRLRAGGLSPLVPLFADGCAAGIRVCVNDVLVYDEDDPNCNDVVLTRTFTATEISNCPSASGEENPAVVASYQITFVRPTLDDIDGDNIDLVVEYDQCGVIDITDPNFKDNYPAPRPEDFPFLAIDGRTFPLTDGESICNIAVSFEDSNPFETCPFTYKFFRTYTVMDWCDQGERIEFVQTVKVGDTTPPVFFGPTQDRNFDGIAEDDLIYTTNAGNQCAAYIRLDAAGVRATDNCSPNVTIMAQIFPGGDLSATPIGSFVVDPNDSDAEITSAIPVGCHL